MVTPPSPETAPHGPHCAHCGHLLRGVRSPICVECGKARYRRISYFDRMEFDAVRAALDLADVPHAFHDPRVGVPGMLTLLDGANLNPVILIEWPHLNHAEEALHRVGLAIPVVLIDETNPYCPCCGFLLRPGVDELSRCRICGTCCTWYEGEHEEPDDSDGST